MNSCCSKYYKHALCVVTAEKLHATAASRSYCQPWCSCNISFRLWRTTEHILRVSGKTGAKELTIVIYLRGNLYQITLLLLFEFLDFHFSCCFFFLNYVSVKRDQQCAILIVFSFPISMDDFSTSLVLMGKEFPRNKCCCLTNFN